MATQVSAPPQHASSAKLEDLAATAALYVTKHDRGTASNQNSYLEDDKLSSAGAAASLKYAKPQDLPSFPSMGLRNDDSAAGAAASVGWANHKSPEHWKPDPSASASKAAQLANDYKVPAPWKPEHSTNGAKAASLAAKGGGRVEIWKPEASAWGNTAASQAFKSSRTGGLSPKIDYSYTGIGRQGSLMAATGAMSGTRKRSESSPNPKPSYPDEANAIANALSAATHANSPSRRAKTDDSAISGANSFTNMPKEMFTSHPPVAPEVDEKRRSDILHASALAMAKQMYSVQQKQADQAAKTQRNDGRSAAVSAHSRLRSDSTTNDESQPMRFNSLQEAAQKLAQERLAKLHDEHAQNREYRTYYGSTPRPTSRLSIRGRARRRASSDGTLDEDREQSQKIRAQMSLFSSSLSQVDEKKRQKDREALMVIAQRNVTASLHGMDEKVFKDTGKMAPSLVNEWEAKAHAAAQKKSESRMENHGKIDVGGGKFVDKGIIEAAAARNVQPVLDEINEKAEKERIRQAELKLEQDASKRSAEAQKTREKEVKEINRLLKEHDKETERARKGEERATRVELKRSAKEDKSKGKESPPAQKTASRHLEPEVEVETTGEPEPIISKPDENRSTSPVVDAGEAKAKGSARVSKKPTASEYPNGNTRNPAGFIAPTGARTSMEMQTQQRLDKIIAEGEKSPEAPKSPTGVKGWLKAKLARRHSKAPEEKLKAVVDDAATGDIDKPDEPKPTATEADISPAEDASVSKKLQKCSVSPVTTEPERSGRSKRRASSVSSLSASLVGGEEAEKSPKPDDFEEARDHFDEELAPAPTLAATKSASPMRDSRFREEI